jgi:glycosyltransferase involved in cell wall biosynthesis
LNKFSIFLPVRNGWPFIADCVISILAQEYKNFDLVVLDNNSTDNTLQWLGSLDDPRLRVITSEKSLTIVESWDRINRVGKHDFMTLIGHDDLYGPKFLSSINSLIIKFPGANLYQTGGCFINSGGRVMRSCLPVSEYETSSDYLESRLKFKRDAFGTGYVIRSSEYERVGGIPLFEKLFFADDALWISLMQNSFKAADPGEHFSVRIHSKSESASLPSAWHSILIGLEQFYNFLKSNKLDLASLRTIDLLGPNFILRYYSNAYIFALVEASQGNSEVSQSVRDCINGSLKTLLPLSGLEDIRRFPRVKIVEMLNKSNSLRFLVPFLWGCYWKFKNRAQR